MLVLNGLFDGSNSDDTGADEDENEGDTSRDRNVTAPVSCKVDVSRRSTWTSIHSVSSDQEDGKVGKVICHSTDLNVAVGGFSFETRVLTDPLFLLFVIVPKAEIVCLFRTRNSEADLSVEVAVGKRIRKIDVDDLGLEGFGVDRVDDSRI